MSGHFSSLVQTSFVCDLSLCLLSWFGDPDSPVWLELVSLGGPHSLPTLRWAVIPYSKLLLRTEWWKSEKCSPRKTRFCSSVGPLRGEMHWPSPKIWRLCPVEGSVSPNVGPTSETLAQQHCETVDLLRIGWGVNLRRHVRCFSTSLPGGECLRRVWELEVNLKKAKNFLSTQPSPVSITNRNSFLAKRLRKALRLAALTISSWWRCWGGLDPMALKSFGGTRRERPTGASIWRLEMRPASPALPADRHQPSLAASLIPCHCPTPYSLPLACGAT